MTNLRLLMDAKDAFAALDRLVYFGDHPEVLLQGLGEYFVESTQHRITTLKESPDGIPWEAVSDWYAELKAAGKATANPADQKTRDPKDLLRLTFQMVENIFYEVNGHTLIIGSPEKYAGRQQDQRPFIGVSAADAEEAELQAEDHLLLVLGVPP